MLAVLFHNGEGSLITNNQTVRMNLNSKNNKLPSQNNSNGHNKLPI